jgi:hypothetical protein
MTQEALSSLKALGNQLRLQLLESAEFRALTVVDRTIMELSEIMNASAWSEAASVSPPAAPEAPQPAPVAVAPVAPPPAPTPAPVAPPVAAPAAQKRAEPIAQNPTSSQSRMAKAIAETIAAKANSLNAASRLSKTLSAAS